MNKLMVLLPLLLLATVVFAQTGLFEMSYGDSPADATAKLKAKGFVQVSQTDDNIKFDGGKNPELPTIELDLDMFGKYVLGWIITYDLNKYPHQVTEVIASLKKLHDDNPWEEIFDYDYIWYLAKEHALYVDINMGESMIIDYTRGNYEDDEYIYYGDEW